MTCHPLYLSGLISCYSLLPSPTPPILASLLTLPQGFCTCCSQCLELFLWITARLATLVPLDLCPNVVCSVRWSLTNLCQIAALPPSLLITMPPSFIWHTMYFTCFLSIHFPYLKVCSLETEIYICFDYCCIPSPRTGLVHSRWSRNICTRN